MRHRGNAAAHARRVAEPPRGATGAGKLGIVGYGHIGTQVGVLAESLGMQVVFYDVETRLALGNAKALGSLDALLEACDVVTLHVPETPSTFQMIAGDQLARMKPGARLINASRGTVVEIQALAAALASRRVPARQSMSSRRSPRVPPMSSSPPCAAWTTSC
jgi:D-3-phosphoglycerate dehydrogenase